MGWDFDFLRRLQHIGIIVINMKHRAPQTRWTNDGLFDALALSYRLTPAPVLGGQRFNWQGWGSGSCPDLAQRMFDQRARSFIRALLRAWNSF